MEDNEKIAREIVYSANRKTPCSGEYFQGITSTLIREIHQALDAKDAQLHEAWRTGKDFARQCDRYAQKIKELEQALTGRTVSCENCNQMGRQVADLTAKLESVMAGNEFAHGVKNKRIDELEAKLEAAREAIERWNSIYHLGIKCNSLPDPDCEYCKVLSHLSKGGEDAA